MTDLSSYQPAATLGEKKLSGERVWLEPFEVQAHSQGLFDALCGDAASDIWTHIPIACPQSVEELANVFTAKQIEWRTLVIVDRMTKKISGMFSFMRIRPEMGSAEIGCVLYSKKLQRTREATEAFYLATQHLFDECKYRRYEWKCNNSNGASKRAALRYGFSYEGTFRQDMIVRGRNRDTAWYSILDSEWPTISAAMKNWLSEKNFDEKGRQTKSLGSFF